MEVEKNEILKLFESFTHQIKNILSSSSSIVIKFEKSKKYSIAYREKGNMIYKEPHDANVHFKIWKFYSKSIACAPLNSKELARGYANRSAFLIHLKKYEDCVKDIDRALLITNSCKLKIKLLCRKTIALIALQDGKQRSAFEKAKFWFNKLNDCKNKESLINKIDEVKELLDKNERDYDFRAERNKKIDCNNDAFELSYNEKFGRCLIAKRYIQPGEFICYDKFCVTSVVANKHFAYCNHCLSISWSSIPCDQCAYAMYCSEECKNEAWKSYHIVECSIHFAACEYENQIIQMSIRTLIMGYLEAGSINQLKRTVDEVLKDDERLKKKDFTDSIFKSILSLSQLKDITTRHAKMAVNALMLLRLNKCDRGKIFVLNEDKLLSKEKKALFLGSLLLKLILIFFANGFCVRENSMECRKDEDPIACTIELCCARGMSCSLIPSLINHSCDNNVNRIYTNDGKVVYYSIQPIKKGCQIFTSYYFHYSTSLKLQRKKLLESMFGISCSCAACSNSWPMLERLKLKSSQRASSVKKLNLNFLSIIDKSNKLDDDKISVTINDFSDDIETILLHEKKPSYYIVMAIRFLIFLLEKKYGTYIKVPNECKLSN